MKREVIQDFLNLPGIAGVALMDGRSRPYFCGIDRTLNFQQKEALAQGILQVVETIPDGFDAVEFQFTEYQVHLYKLDRGMVLLVLTSSSLVYADYAEAIKPLKAVLKEDIPNAIATFRLVAGNITLTGLHYSKQTTEAAALADDTAAITESTHFAPSAPGAPLPSPALLDPFPEERPDPTLAPAPEAKTLKAAIVALNHLSQFTTHYLGTHVIANYWKATRPQADGLAQLQIDRSAQFFVTGSLPQGALTPLTPEEQACLQAWVSAFIKRCSQVIRDFPTIVEQKGLNDQQKALLLHTSPALEPPNLPTLNP